MDSTRLNRVNQLMTEELAGIFQRFSQKYYKGLLISVTRVRTSPDLSLARVNLSFFPSTQAKEILDVIKENRGMIKNELASGLGKQLRKMPELNFYLDDSLDYEENIDRLLRGEGENPIR